MNDFVGQKEVGFTEEDFFKLGLELFSRENPMSFMEAVVKKRVEFFGRNGTVVDFNFFQEISCLGKQTLIERMEK